MNDTPIEIEAGRCLHELFEEQAKLTPDAVAVAAPPLHLTYWQLECRANQLAHFLRELGVGPDVLVGICLERSLDLIIALLALLKAGGAYVPLDPTSPKARLVSLLQDTQASVLLTQTALASLFASTQTQIIQLDRCWEIIATHAEIPPSPLVTPEHLAYVIYTSGSTGSPKGVMISQGSLVNYVLDARRRFSLSPGDHVLQFASISFDASAEEIYPCLTSGATLFLRSSRMLDSFATFLQCCRDWHISVLDLPTAYWYELTLHLQEEAAALPDSLRLVIVGGERAIPEHLMTWLRLFGSSLRLLNTYGPTETTIAVTASELHLLSPDEVGGEIPIGSPIANAQVYVLDASGQPVPPGSIGELYIGGPCLARGYHRQPELTSERFVPHSFSSEPNACLYRSGDLVRSRADGQLAYVGRTDQQVKIRGFRVELGEIETALRRNPAIREAVVVLREEGGLHPRLVAYLIWQGSQRLSSQSLQRYLQSTLPSYMIPGTFVAVDALPLSPNGKVDHRALPAPALASPLQSRRAPLTQMHSRLREVWEELLQQPHIDIHDNFFDLGGDSLVAMRMLSLVERLCGQRLPLSILLENATIASLARVLEQRYQTDQTRTPVVPVQSGGDRSPFFYLHGDWLAGAFYCVKVARLLGSEQPFYALEPYRFDGLSVPPSLQEIAAAHIEAMQKIQPHGPYQLGGFCNGAVVAHEMARQLHEAGEEIAILVLIDADSLKPPKSRVYRHIRRWRMILPGSQSFLFEVFLLSQYVQRWFRRAPTTEMALSKEQVISASSRLPLLSIRQLLPMNWTDHYNWSLDSYRASPYSGKTVMIWTRDTLHIKEQWIPLLDAEQTKHIIMPGTHETCRTRHVEHLALHIGSCLLFSSEKQPL